MSQEAITKTEESGILEESELTRKAIPPKYAVLLHNDDYTTMEFVIDLLKKVFNKSGDEATIIMLKIHHEGKGIAGIYSHDIAETKVAQVHRLAAESGFPLKASMEAVESSL